MQLQDSDKEFDSEEIYQNMIRETFGDPGTKKTHGSESFLGAGFSKQIGQEIESIDNLLSQRLINTLTAQLQSILPGAFRITTNPEQCLSCANLHSWSPGRSYYSMFEMKHSKSVWILHLSRSVGEGLASLLQRRKSRDYSNIFKGLREADSLIYLEIGELLRNIFSSLIELWPKNEKLKVARCRHILQLVFLNDSDRDEEYVVIPFHLDNRECSGDFHLVFPQRYLLSI
ncbi:MAG: hypothetical protein MAG581_00341 [Deltaproteobacteria bacterium]|jgi:hypothetical protein|nr:hypothetical protein [Deltaproteobacteria bacterium]